jgi:hypothetical protein
MNKNRFWLFRTNLKEYEYYHQYNNLETFKNNCHDFYLMQCIYFLENKMFDEIMIWRLGKKNEDIIFDVNGRKFIQKFVKNFNECFKYPKPQVTFFRGGFPEYCALTKANPSFFGKKLYLGAGVRSTPIYNGIYDIILVETEKDFNKSYPALFLPFFKTVNKKIFYPKDLEKKFDIIFPANFTQIKYKGQEDFISKINRSEYLKSLKIAHIGNQPNIGKKLCQDYKVSNITFMGYMSRIQLNDLINQSKIGIVNSNNLDGCPRVITEILGTGIPLIINRATKLLDYYKSDGGAMVYYDLEQQIKDILNDYDIFKELSMNFLKKITMKKICDLNYQLWV